MWKYLCLCSAMAAFAATATLPVHGQDEGTDDVPELVPHGQPLVHEAAVEFAEFSPDGNIVLTQDKYGVCWLWDAGTQSLIGGSIQGPHRKTGVNFDHSGPTIVGMGSPFQRIMVAGFSPDGRDLIAISESLQYWDPMTAFPTSRPFLLEKSGALTILSPSRKLAFLANSSGSYADASSGALVMRRVPATGRLLDTRTGETCEDFLVLEEFNGAFDTAAISPDDRMLLVACSGGVIQRWNLARRRRLYPDLVHPLTHIDSVRFCSDGTRALIEGGSAGQVWDVKSGKAVGPEIRLRSMHKGQSSSLSPDGQHVLVEVERGKVEIHDASTGNHVLSLNAPNARSWGFSPDGKLVFIAGSKTSVHDAQTGELCAEGPKSEGLVVFSANSDRVLVVDGKEVFLWEIPEEVLSR